MVRPPFPPHFLRPPFPLDGDQRLRCLAHLIRKAHCLQEGYDRDGQRFGRHILQLMETVIDAVYSARGGAPPPQGLRQQHAPMLNALLDAYVQQANSTYSAGACARARVAQRLGYLLGGPRPSRTHDPRQDDGTATNELRKVANEQDGFERERKPWNCEPFLAPKHRHLYNLAKQARQVAIMSSPTWSIQDAKNRFSAVVDAAQRGEPQWVTRRGKPVGVLLSAEMFERLQSFEKAAAPSFTDSLLDLPQDDVPFERMPLRQRDVEF